ncbi:Tricalbin-2 [Lithohypha guttulata]|uniref:Tricalbin-2 n=1 Tax=Lithohypha guttulata TaxID=1690604 RepID=A0AAN7TEH8_9EURO|nr:Tricalbin-2 [Lithohypha guttulata]
MTMLSSFKHEAKQQAVEDLARDPDSRVSASDVEKTILEESRKAGAPTFIFDPAASPEEKAAQARARGNALHTNRPKGAGLKSDINDGPDDYDLPPPSTAGVVVPSTTEDQQPRMNGSFPEDDQWKKTGWAPRFELKDEHEDATLITDHQTFLEGKLDDKFFGDWYHNAAVIVFACLASWLVAICGGGLAWVTIVMAICGTYYRTSIRRTRRNFRDDITRELAKGRLESDHESLEWMNSFLVKFWPIFAPNLATSIVQSVDQVLSTSTPAFLDSMRMETFTLGTKPPRMEHVKTYPREDPEIVMMDWRFSFTPTDTMDMTARQLKNKINPKVVLAIRIGKAMVSKSMKIIVEDFAFSGIMRVKMKLQLPYPYVDRIDICFLERPEIDYVCKPLGGETLGFDINFIPGLQSFIMEQIHANLAPMMYAPNVFPIEVAKMLSGNPVDLAIGVVAITLHGGHGLRNPDKFSGTPDPYVVVSINGRNELGRTQTIHENADPRWNETLYIIITNFTDALTLQVFDFNELRKDKELGAATFPLERLESVAEHESEHLEVIAGGKQRGVLNCDVRFFPVLEGGKDVEGNALPAPESNTGIARLTIEQAKDLDSSKSMVGALNPYGVLLLNGKEVHITKKLKRTNNPIFPEPSTSVLVTDKRKARIGLVIKDDRDLATDAVLGTYQIKLDDMLTLMQKGQEWFNLHGTQSGRAKLMVEWKPVALTGVTSSGGYITPVGVLRVHMQKASDLRNLETLGKSDSYGRVLLNGIPKGRTVTFKNNLEPTWDEVIYVPVHTIRERITLEVMDEEKLGKDRSLGQIDVSLADYIKENEQDGGYLVHDTRQVFNDGLRLQGKGGAKGVLSYTVSFFPTLNVIDPEEEKEEQETALPEVSTSVNGSAPGVEGQKSLEAAGNLSVPVDRTESIAAPSVKAPSLQESVSLEKKQPPKIRMTVDDLPKYESGLLVFKLIEGNFQHKNVMLEIVMDDHIFPSYSSGKVRQQHHTFGEIGDAFIRELDWSRITLRVVEKVDKEGDDGEDHVIAKLTGQTIQVLSQCLYTPTELTIRGDDGGVSKVTVSLRFLPVQMNLDPSESINNMGTLRVDVLDAAELPAADRNGYSDPYCKFKLNGKEIHKTKTQKKTLHPAWNETFETLISSRTAADFRVDIYDWDFGDKADFLGGANIKLAELKPLEAKEYTYPLDGKSGVIRLKMVFKPSYITRSRQGTSTFQGTFAPAGKVVGAPVKGVAKVGGGVVKGASFLKRNFTHRGSKDEPELAVNGVREGSPVPDVLEAPATPARSMALSDNNSPMAPVSTHNRHSSYTSTTFAGGAQGTDSGTAHFLIVSASGFPEKADVQVHVSMKGAKGKTKELYKTKHLKPKDGLVMFGEDENFKVACAADTTFQMVVKDHEVFRDKELGEGMFFVSDQGSGSEQTVNCGSGTVVIRSSFAPESGVNSGIADASLLRPSTSGAESPVSRKEGGPRRSFFGKRDASGRIEPA